MVAMAEVTQRQVLDLLHEVADDVSYIRDELHEVVVMMRIMSDEAELGQQRLAELKRQYRFDH